MSKPLVLPKITDYWDDRKEAISNYTLRLMQASPEEADRLTSEISAGIAEHVRFLGDQWLPRATFAVAETLYRAANTTSFWNSCLADYLSCSAGVFFSLVAQQGLRLHYVIDNSFPDLQRPTQIFPPWFAVCGIHYECPQLHESNGTPPHQSRAVCTQRLREASKLGQHYLILDIDSTEASFEVPIEQIGTKGVLTIVRNQGPDAGSKALAYLSGEPLT